MKKILAILALAFTTLPFYADIYFPHRFFEVGFDVSLEAGQNILTLDEIMKKELVIDLPKIYDGLCKTGVDGFIFNLGQNVDVFTNININGYGTGLRIGESVSGSVGISKEFFKLLAVGNDLNEPSTVGMSISMEAYADLAVPIYFKVGKLKVTATPSYYVPVLYLPNPSATLTYEMKEDGNISATAEADVTLYSVIGMSGFISTNENGEPAINFGGIDLSSIIEEPFSMLDKTGGVDFGLQLEYPVLEKLDIGGYLNVPVFPAHMKHSISAHAKFEATMEPVLDYYTTPEDERGEVPYQFTPAEEIFSGFVTDDSANFSVNRPFRFGLEAAFRPFGNWFTIHPKLGLAMRNPFGKDFSLSSVYPEYSLDARLSFFNVINLDLCTQYTDRVFMHTLGLGLNIRIMELNILIGTGSGDFLKSFAISGLTASVGVSFGF